MQIQSLGYRTELIFPGFDGEIINREDYLVVLTPTNPTYFWGNFLLFPQPPGPGDLERWKSIFAREISARFDVYHLAFAWDTVQGETGAIQPFLDEGFDLNQSIVLSAQQVRIPPKYNQEVKIRSLAEDWEWQQVLETQVLCRPPEHNLEGYRVFKEQQIARYRQMAAAGLGAWFGAFLGDQLVADLGLFGRDGIGRFQQVETHPDFRRRGICGALVYQVSRYGLDQMGLHTLVMSADEHYHAARIYETVGFEPRERQANVQWWDKTRG